MRARVDVLYTMRRLASKTIVCQEVGGDGRLRLHRAARSGFGGSGTLQLACRLQERPLDLRPTYQWEGNNLESLLLAETTHSCLRYSGRKGRVEVVAERV